MNHPKDPSAKDFTQSAAKLEGKDGLRLELRRRLKEAIHLDSETVVGKLVGFLEGEPECQVVAAYAALPDEVNLREIFGKVDKDWVFPRVRGEDLNFYRVKNYDEEMQVGAFGIMEPKDGLEEVRVEQIDVFLCPGLGFDRNGGRLGRGRGFYDRMLKQAKPEAVKIGVCFPFQIVDDMIMEAHDVRMNGVVG